MDELFDILFCDEVSLTVEICTSGEPVWVVKSIKGDKHYCAITKEEGQPLESFISAFVRPSAQAVCEKREAEEREGKDGVKDMPSV